MWHWFITSVSSAWTWSTTSVEGLGVWAQNSCVDAGNALSAIWPIVK